MAARQTRGLVEPVGIAADDLRHRLAAGHQSAGSSASATPDMRCQAALRQQAAAQHGGCQHAEEGGASSALQQIGNRAGNSTE